MHFMRWVCRLVEHPEHARLTRVALGERSFQLESFYLKLAIKLANHIGLSHSRVHQWKSSKKFVSSGWCAMFNPTNIRQTLFTAPKATTVVDEPWLNWKKIGCVSQCMSTELPHNATQSVERNYSIITHCGQRNDFNRLIKVINTRRMLPILRSTRRCIRPTASRRIFQRCWMAESVSLSGLRVLPLSTFERRIGNQDAGRGMISHPEFGPHWMS